MSPKRHDATAKEHRCGRCRSWAPRSAWHAPNDSTPRIYTGITPTLFSGQQVRFALFPL
jgi:hypothetical protein